MREQLSRRERGLQRDHLIEVLALRKVAERIGLLNGRFGDDMATRNRRERRAGTRQMLAPITKVGAERDVGDIDHEPGAARSTTTSACASGPGSATFGLRTATRADRMRGVSPSVSVAMRSAICSRYS